MRTDNTLVWDEQLKMWGVLGPQGQVLLCIREQDADNPWSRERFRAYLGTDELPPVEEAETLCHAYQRLGRPDLLPLPGEKIDLIGRTRADVRG